MEDNPKMQLFEKIPISKPVLPAFNAVINLFGVGSHNGKHFI